MLTEKRMQREAAVVEIMIRKYCRALHHPEDKLCPECGELIDYARKRLVKCPWQENKTTCGQCPVHCYKPEMRRKIQEVMRYAGPRMLLANPVVSVRHFLDGRRKKPLGRAGQSRNK